MNPIFFFCALICQNIYFWEDRFRINGCWEVPNEKIVYRVQKMDGVNDDFMAKTWGATQKCRRLTPEEHLRILSYYVDFDSDGGVCR